MQTQINRRTFFRKAGSTSISLVGAAAAVKACMAPKVALAASTPIGDLFEQWREIDQRSNDDGSEENYGEYARLQALITEAEPTSARDMAIQIIVETDNGVSGPRDEFMRRVFALTLAGRA